jgi:methylene-tetrahydromethanopterin dehydrogenase
MAEKRILHMLSPLKHMSPFDVNMALDAGFDAVLPYTNVTLDEVNALVQDAIFSRPPQDGMKTGFFFAGKDAILALDMLGKAKAAMVPPFVVSLFADPAGSFTTAAAMVAVAEKVLRVEKKTTLKGKHVAVFGATGVVGFCSAVIAAIEGAHVTLIGHDGADRVRRSSVEIEKRFGVKTAYADGSTEALKAHLLAQSEIAFCAGRAGTRILSTAELNAAKGLMIAGDVNAVPPSGVEGLDLFAAGALIPGTKVMGIGPLAIGNVKYQTEAGLFGEMIKASAPVSYDFRDAFTLARKLAG